MHAIQAEAAYGGPRVTVRRWIQAGKLVADQSGYFREEDLKVLDAARLKRPGPGRNNNAVERLKNVEKPDPLLPDAIKLCRETDRYNCTNIQRKLHVGYNRARRLLENVLADNATNPLKKAAKKKAGGISGPDPHETYVPQTATSRQQVDLRKALAGAQKTEMEVAIKMKDLISRELVSRLFRKIYSIDSTQWRGLGPRVAPDVMAVCEVEDPSKEVEISDRIEQEVFRTLGHVKRVINEFLAEIEAEERIEDEPERDDE